MGGPQSVSGGSRTSGTNAANEAARRAAEEARRAAEAARRAAEEARQQQAAARKATANTQKAAQAPGQTPDAAKKSKADLEAAIKAEQKASANVASTDKALQSAEEKVALTAKKAETEMKRANTLATQEKKTPPFSQKDIDSVKPRANELVPAFDGSNRKAQLEKMLGVPAPSPSQVAEAPRQAQPSWQEPPASLDVVSARDAQAARRVPNGQIFMDPSTGAKYQVRQNATTGETVLSDNKSGNTVTIKPDGSYTSTVRKTESKTGDTRNITWTKTSDAQGKPTSLKSQQSHTARPPQTGATTTTTTTQYNVGGSPPVPRSRTEQVQMERPPPALAQRRGTPQGPVSVKTETQFNEQGIATRRLETTEVRTPGFNANDVNAFESSTHSAFQQAAKGEDHYKTNNAPTNLKPGQSSLTVTEETLFNEKGEPAVSKQKTESVAVKPLAADKNGNGVQVVRSEQQVNRGPENPASTDALPAISSQTPGTVNSRTTVTGYDPDGSRFDKGQANRTQTVSQSSGMVDAHGQLHLTKHQPTEAKSLQEGDDNRWTYDHVQLQVGADGTPVKGQKPKELDRERQLPWYEDAADFLASNCQELADMAGNAASDALGFAKDVVLKPIDAAIDAVTAPLEDKLTEEVKKLNSAGDTLTLSGGLDVKVGLKGGIEGEAEIERTDDGKYQLSAEVTADMGVGFIGSASISAGGRMEFKFDTPEQAAKAAVILGKGPAALASGGEDHKFLLQHLSAMEMNVGGELEAGLGAKFGPGGAELSASLGATTGYRVEFDKGKPTHLVRTTEFEGSGAASLATGLKGKAGLNVGGDVTGSVSLETRLPLDPSKLDGTDVLAFMASPASASFAGPAQTSITVEGSVDTGDQGQFFSAEMNGLSGEDVRSVTKRLMDGQFENAFDDVKVDAQVTTGSFKDRELGMDVKLGVADFNVNARHRDVTAQGGNGNGGTHVSLGSGKRRGGSDGPSGGNGPSRGNGTKGTDSRTAKPPGSTATHPPPPTQYRVHPRTGELVPVARPEDGPSRTGRPGAPETRPASPDKATEASGQRPVPVVRNPELPGRTTHVRYDDGRLRIEAGPDATAEDIQAHMETARVLQRYEGAVGKVRQLIDKVKQALTGMPGYGSQGFESRLEVQKLTHILQNLEATQQQLNTRLAGATGNPTPATAAQRAELEKWMTSIESQLRTHETQINSLASGRGYVAQTDDVTPSSNVARPERSWESLSEYASVTHAYNGDGDIIISSGKFKVLIPSSLNDIPEGIPDEDVSALGEQPFDELLPPELKESEETQQKSEETQQKIEEAQQKLKDALTARIQSADKLLDQHQSTGEYKPLNREQVLTILSAECLKILTSTYPGDTSNKSQEEKNAAKTTWESQKRIRIENAMEAIKVFKERSAKGHPLQNKVVYGLSEGMVGELVHVRAAWVMNPAHKHKIQYTLQAPENGKKTTNNEEARFASVMHPGVDPKHPKIGKNGESGPMRVDNPGGLAQKNEINRDLIAPITVDDRVGAHELFLQDQLSKLSTERRQEISNWVASAFAGDDEANPRNRMAVWIRNAGGEGTQTTAQNMTKERFQQILQAAKEQGVDDIILLGDEMPKDWLKGTPYSMDGKNRAYAFNELWNTIPEGPDKKRGIAEQLAVFTALYKGPNSSEHPQANPNMLAIVTNKSGGPDIASLAGIPQIQLAEMAPDESRVLHRMGFQSLTSHAWSVLDIPKRERGMADPEQVKGKLDPERFDRLKGLIERSKNVRKWHIDQLEKRGMLKNWNQ